MAASFMQRESCPVPGKRLGRVARFAAFVGSISGLSQNEGSRPEGDPYHSSYTIK